MKHHLTGLALCITLLSGQLLAGEALIWQGFNHQWKRKALGLFSTPHRISILSSLLDENQQSILIGQSPGVDGNYMDARAHLEKIKAEGVEFDYQIVPLSFSDSLEDEGPTRVLSAKTTTVTFPLKFKASKTNFSAILGGFSLESKCVERNEFTHECNSNGFWPYKIDLEVKSCKTDQFQENIQCEISFTLGRAWTPNHGGVPLFAPKAFNYAMEFNLKVGVLLAQAEKGNFSAHNYGFQKTLHSNREQRDEHFHFPNLTPYNSLGIRQLSFEFSGRGDNQPGRYLGGVKFLISRDYSGWDISGGIFIPKTVNDTPLKWEVGLTSWNFSRNTHFEVLETHKAEVPICVESREAPFFSKWEKCQSLGYPINQEFSSYSL